MTWLREIDIIIEFIVNEKVKLIDESNRIKGYIFPCNFQRYLLHIALKNCNETREFYTRLPSTRQLSRIFHSVIQGVSKMIKYWVCRSICATLLRSIEIIMIFTINVTIMSVGSPLEDPKTILSNQCNML